MRLTRVLPFSLFVLTACPHANPPFRGGADASTSGGDANNGGDDTGETTDNGAIDGGVEVDLGMPEGDSGTSNLVRERSCETVVHFRPQGGRDIFIAGTFNNFDPTATRMIDPEIDGDYTATLNLAPGLYPYKFVVDGSWMLDPSHKYRAYDNQVENSGLRVPDCHVPLVELASSSSGMNGPGRGNVDLVLRYTEAKSGPGPDAQHFALSLLSAGVSRPLDATEINWNTDTWELSISLKNLGDGKHTVSATMPNTAGTGSNTIHVPFWVEADKFDWHDAIIYMVMVDRFRDGDPSNNAAPTPGAVPTADFMGGDLQGVTEQIEAGYFDALGVHALWLSPFNKNPVGAYGDGDGLHSVTGYHGYWPMDPRAVDDRIGGDQALKDMVAAAHRHGIRILADFVINHVHELHPYVAQHPEWFSVLPNGCICGTEGCDWTTHRLDCLFKPYLPDVNWLNNDASETFIADAMWWLSNFDLDGLRVDAVKHVPDGAIFNLATNVEEQYENAGTNYFLVGETAMGWSDCDPHNPSCNAEDYGTISRYMGVHALDGQFDFVLHHGTALSVWAYENRGLIHADVWTQASQYRYPSEAIMTTYVGSHDESRFVSHVTDPSLAGNKWPEQQLPAEPMTSDIAYRKLGLAETWNLTIPGAPLLYYGDEYGEYGAADPDNRHRMQFGNDLNADQTELMSWIRAVGTARWELPQVRRGSFTTLMAAETFWAYLRGLESTQQFAIVAFNRSAMPVTQTVIIDSRYGLGAGASLRDRISGASMNVPAANTVEIALGPYSAAIIAP